jgi:hypothetical protein
LTGQAAPTDQFLRITAAAAEVAGPAQPSERLLGDEETRQGFGLPTWTDARIRHTFTIVLSNAIIRDSHMGRKHCFNLIFRPDPINNSQGGIECGFVGITRTKSPLNRMVCVRLPQTVQHRINKL